MEIDVRILKRVLHYALGTKTLRARLSTNWPCHNHNTQCFTFSQQ